MVSFREFLDNKNVIEQLRIRFLDYLNAVDFEKMV